MTPVPRQLCFDRRLLDPEAARKRYASVRDATLELAAPLSDEDMAIQSMPDVSPTKWHLAHTSWFFETFILKRYLPDYSAFSPDYHYLFNSYYEAEGARHPRPERGLISRPGVQEIHDYRRHVDTGMLELFGQAADGNAWETILSLMELGCQHEQQHQELLLTDIKHVLSCNPLVPAYIKRKLTRQAAPAVLGWCERQMETREVGHDGDGFAFDCEGPRHPRIIAPHALADRLVTNGEYLEFLSEGGYGHAEFWLSDGWGHIQNAGWRRPIYWQQRDKDWFEFTLAGLQPLDPARPVSHLSLYEADAYAAFRGARLPREYELEIAMADRSAEPDVSDNGELHPQAANGAEPPKQLFGEVWQWTQSSYSPYPGFRPAAGAVGEYNGKFMCNQYVLKGSSRLTPTGHTRATYRNFFPANARWQMTGLRLAKDL